MGCRRGGSAGWSLVTGPRGRPRSGSVAATAHLPDGDPAGVFTCTSSGWSAPASPLLATRRPVSEAVRARPVILEHGELRGGHR